MWENKKKHGNWYEQAGHDTKYIPVNLTRKTNTNQICTPQCSQNESASIAVFCEPLLRPVALFNDAPSEHQLYQAKYHRQLPSCLFRSYATIRLGIWSINSSGLAGQEESRNMLREGRQRRLPSRIIFEIGVCGFSEWAHALLKKTGLLQQYELSQPRNKRSSVPRSPHSVLQFSVDISTVYLI